MAHMRTPLLLTTLVFYVFCSGPTVAFDVDRKTVNLRFVDLPSVSVQGLDFSKLHAEVAFGEISLGDPELRTTKSWCVPKGSDNAIKHAVEIPTHYYEVSYRVGNGVMALRDGDGHVLHSERIDALESNERYGHDNCKYWMPNSLSKDYERDVATFRDTVEAGVTAYFKRNAGQILDRALFFNVVEEKAPLYYFKDKVHDYADINDASDLALVAYTAMQQSIAGLGMDGREDLQRAVNIWERALEESDPGDKKARINRKATVKLHESIGVAQMALGNSEAAVNHLERSTRLSSMVTSRTDGTGTTNLIARARERKRRATGNVALQASGVDLEALMVQTERHRGRVRIGVLPPGDLARLNDENMAFFGKTVIAEAAREADERQEAVASGSENPFERMIGHSAMQGFFLFLMPYPEKRDAFPDEVTELTHLNRLRVPNHTFDSVPESIGNMKSLQVLDLSKNRIRELPAAIGLLDKLEKLDLSGNELQSLPDEIGQLDQLKVLELKDNPLDPGELLRIKQLLPRCKIKG